jgi:hypothetical protein
MNSRNGLFASVVVLTLASLATTGCDKDNDPVGAETPSGPRTVVIDRVGTGWWTESGTNGITSSGHGRSPVAGYKARMEGISNINIGIFENPVVKSYLQNWYAGTPGQYRVEANFRWKGSIAGNGIAGAGARVEIVMYIFDRSLNLITSYNIHEKEVRGSNLSIGGIIDSGSRLFNVDFTLPQGKDGFYIRFMMKCEAWSGLLGAITQCHFGDSQATDHYSEWTSLKVTAF